MNLVSGKTVLKSVFDAIDIRAALVSGILYDSDIVASAVGPGSMDVAVSSGDVFLNYTQTPVTYGGGTITLDPADPSLPRYDIVYLSDVGVLSKSTGTPATTDPVTHIGPLPEAWPFGCLPIAIWYIPAGITGLTDAGVFMQDVRQFSTPHAASHADGGFDEFAPKQVEYTMLNLPWWDGLPTLTITPPSEHAATAVRGGVSNDAATGGLATITGGHNFSTGNGGDAGIAGGIAFGDGNGGSVSVSGGGTGGTGTGGAVQILGGPATSGAPGGVVLVGGYTTGTHKAGILQLNGGFATGGTGDGGDAYLQGGASFTNSNGGNAYMFGGESSGDGSGGNVDIRGGAATVGTPGSVSLQGGNSNASANPGGNVTITGGSASNGSSAGSVIIAGGANSSTGAGGDVTIHTGQTGSGIVGFMEIYGHDAPPNVDGGDIEIRGGAASGTAEGGQVYVTGGSGNGGLTVGAYAVFRPGTAGAHGILAIQTGGSLGTAGQKLTSDGAGGVVWA